MKFFVSVIKYPFLWLLLLMSICVSSCKKDLLYPVSSKIVNVGAVNDINSILFVNDTLGYMVGGSKYFTTELLCTKDGGKTWIRSYLDTNECKSVYSLAYNGSKVMAAGYDGKFYIPQNNDSVWERVQSSYWQWFQHLAFASPNKGFVVAGEAYGIGSLYSFDTNFNVTLLDTFQYQLCDIEFANAKIGYTCGYGVMLKTVDGGNSWQLQNVKGDFFKGMSMLDSLNIWMAGYNGCIMHTSDGGTHWETQRNGNDPLLIKYRFRAILFKDLNTGYAVGDKGIIVKTIDGGAHWATFETLTNQDLKCITLQQDGSIWIGGTNGLVLRIVD